MFKRPLLLVGGLVGGTFGYFYLKDSRASFHRNVFMPICHSLLDAETSHNFAIFMAKYHLSPRETHDNKSPLLITNLWGKQVCNPIGLAAGFDKHADAIDALFDFGFGMVEIGSVTPNLQEGNPKPRMFRLAQDDAVINRYGFNSEGHEAVELKLRQRLHKFNFGQVNKDKFPSNLPRSLRAGKLLGVNLGKNKASAAESHDDYIQGVKRLGKYADYLVVNVSSPNTPGLRSLQKREAMESLLNQVKAARDEFCHHSPPLLVKIAPDLTAEEIQDIAETIEKCGIDGVVIGNTTISRPESLKSDLKLKREYGGLSGSPLKPLTIQVIQEFNQFTQGRVPIIACGGIASADDALEYAKAGASAVQLYTSLGFKGPSLIPEIKDDLVEKLQGQKWSDLK